MLEDLKVGDRVGKYVIREAIDEGGMGIVYRARHAELSRLEVAIKTIPTATMSDEAIVRFKTEALAVSAINHPNVVQLIDYGVQDGRPYMVLEFLRGRTLGAYLREKGSLSVDRAVDILLEICAGVFMAHQHQIVHRDIKPGNIFIAETPVGEQAKVFDFGISKLPLADHLSVPGEVVGTPRYMAPEQASAGTADEKTDQYALGILLYQMLTGHLPHEEVPTAHVLDAIKAGDYTSPHRHRPDLPKKLVQVIARAMNVDPARRFPTVHELGRALVEFASDIGKARWTNHYTRPPRPIPAQHSGPNPGRQPPTAPTYKTGTTTRPERDAPTVVRSGDNYPTVRATPELLAAAGLVLPTDAAGPAPQSHLNDGPTTFDPRPPSSLEEPASSPTTPARPSTSAAASSRGVISHAQSAVPIPRTPAKPSSSSSIAAIATPDRDTSRARSSKYRSAALIVVAVLLVGGVVGLTFFAKARRPRTEQHSSVPLSTAAVEVTPTIAATPDAAGGTGGPTDATTVVADPERQPHSTETPPPAAPERPVKRKPRPRFAPNGLPILR